MNGMMIIEAETNGRRHINNNMTAVIARAGILK